MEWIAEIFWVVIEFLIDCCNPFLSRTGVWFWLAVALIVCVIIGLGIYFWS